MDNSPAIAASPRQYDIYFGVTALICYAAIGMFAAAQADRSLRVSGDLRFCIVLWLVIVGGTSAICWLARPHLVHVLFVFEIGRRLGAEISPYGPDRPEQLALRSAIWKTSGVVSACALTLATALDIGVAVGGLDLRGQNLDITSEVILSVACITAITRIIGPNLSEIDEVYQAARAHGERERKRTRLDGQRS